MVMIYPRLRRVHCQDIGELLKAKSGEKNCPAKKSRKREGSANLAKENAPRRTPKRLSRKRTSRPTLDLTRLSGEKTSYPSLPRTRQSQPLLSGRVCFYYKWVRLTKSVERGPQVRASPLGPRFLEEKDGMREPVGPSSPTTRTFDKEKETERTPHGGRCPSKHVARGDAEKERQRVWLRSYS